MTVIVQLCSVCGELIITEKVGSCLCSTDDRIVVKKIVSKRPKLIVHRKQIQAKSGSHFERIVNKVLSDEIGYLRLKGKVIDD